MLLVQAGGRPKRVLAADRNQPVNPGSMEVGRDALGASVLLEGVGPRGAKDRAAARQDAAYLRHAEWAAIPLQRPVPAIAIADELVVAVFDPLADDRPDHRVQ